MVRCARGRCRAGAQDVKVVKSVKLVNRKICSSRVFFFPRTASLRVVSPDEIPDLPDAPLGAAR
jgi:hypothetical protein